MAESILLDRNFDLAKSVYNSIDFVDFKYEHGYNKNDIVRFKNGLYISIIDNNHDIPDKSFYWDTVNCS